MGFFDKVIDTVIDPIGLSEDYLLGGAERDALQRATNELVAGGQQGIDTINQRSDQAIGRLDPFANFGSGQIDALISLLTPQGQYSFLQNNPMFQAAVDQSTGAISAAGAAGGKHNSGGMLKALFNNYLSQGQNFVQPQINNLLNSVEVGRGAVNAQGAADSQAGRSIADILAAIANAKAGGIVAKQNSRDSAFDDVLSFGTQIFSGGMPGA
jgi:hypothetical protein